MPGASKAVGIIIYSCYAERPEGVVLPAPVPQVEPKAPCGQVSLSKGSLEKPYFAYQTFGTVRKVGYLK